MKGELKTFPVRRSTYGEFSDLDWLREGSENSGRLVHWQNEGNTRRWFAIAVFPIISFRYGEQLVERQASSLGLCNDPMKVQFLHPSIDTMFSQSMSFSQIKMDENKLNYLLHTIQSTGQ